MDTDLRIPLTSEQKEQERKEFDGLFVNVSDDDDEAEADTLDFTLKPKVE